MTNSIHLMRRSTMNEFDTHHNNGTLTSQGDCIVTAECVGNCNGSEKLIPRNNLFIGQTDFLQPDDLGCVVYEETSPRNPFDIDYSVIVGAKLDSCPGPHDICGVSAGLVNPSIGAFDAHLMPGSPAIDAGTTAGAPRDDYDGRSRDARPDIGAYERYQR
ncbi:MAG: hypothetical protein HY650_16755 [Acidobacteria bacterium]|nr:hypothetical protein [Acidobacteriota bacterium]